MGGERERQKAPSLSSIKNQMGLSLKYQPSLSVTNPKKSKAGINLHSGSLGLIWKAGGSRESGGTARGTVRAGGMPDSGRGFDQWS